MFKKLLFTEIAPLVRLGSKRPLTGEDLPALEQFLHPKDAESSFATIATQNPYRFIWQSFRAAGFSSNRAIIANLCRLPFAIGGPLVMRELLERVALLSTMPELTPLCIVLACALSIMVLADGVIVQHFYYNALITHARIVNGLSMRVFRQSLRLTRAAQMTTQTGDLVNHVASDTEGVGEASFFIPEFLQSLMLFIGGVVLLFYFLGTAAIAAVATMLLMSPVTRAAASKFQKYDSEMWKHRDDRVTLMSQILSGIRIIKYFAWERSIVQEVDAIRGKELGAFIKLIRGEALGVMLFLSTSTLVAFVGFGTFSLLGGTLTASVIFPCLLLFMQLEGPIGMLPHFLKNLAHARVAAERLHGFFLLGTHEQETARNVSAEREAIEVVAEGVTLSFANAFESSRKTVLNNISLHINKGESIAIVGAVGAGKSSLLLSLLGETAPESGTISFPSLAGKLQPRIAYVPQEAYILNATIQENIAFGNAVNSKAEMDVALYSTAMHHDIVSMSAGLETEIGERGVNLSGGQKMRIALARAVMHKPGLVLLDDPLAAIDVATEAHVVENLLFGEWHEITRVVATHRLAHLHRFDRIIFLNNGSIETSGSLNHVLATSPAFREFYAEHAHAEELTQTLSVQKPATASANQEESNGKLVEDEDRAIGSVKAEVFYKYLFALGGTNRKQAPWVYASLVLTCLLVVALPIAQSLWLGTFADALKTNQFQFEWMKNPLLDIAVYGAIGLCVLAANYAERLTWMMRATLAGRDIHNQTLRSVLHAPLRFFDSTPMGRILNRFSRDIQLVDDELSWNFESALRSLSLMAGTLILVCYNAPIVILFAVPALAIFYRIQKMYRLSAREAKRLSSIARSPRYAHYKETISGLPVVRAYQKEELFTEKFVDLLGYFNRTFWASIMLNRWFSSRAPLVSGVIALATTISVVLLIKSGSISAGVAGVVITYSITFWGNLNWCVRSFSEVEMCMTAFERVQSYGSLESEPRTTAPEIGIANTDWIRNGAIEFRNVFARYAPHLPYVLKDVSFTIRGGMRVGIVGRTGSGKTTLFQSLFRFIELEKGSIFIDGINIAAVPHEFVRRAMSVIPQDPTLFIGTIRSNLDRFNQYSDAQVLEALQRVKMLDAVNELGGLQAHVVENGYNFSQGQRQLLCLARAILTGAKVIVMDEATASVDVQTDAVIQETIRTQFVGVTVLIIAHRLNSVADADLIIEMANGEVLRAEPPNRVTQAQSELV